MLILIILLILLFGGGFGYYGHSTWGPQYGFPVGIGTIRLVLLICYFLGLLR